MKRADDAGVSTIVGAIVVLAVLGIALLYVNGVHVPRQGESLEVDAREQAESSLAKLAGALSSGADATLAHDVTLRAERASPPLLSGLVLSPARAEGRLALEPDAPRVTISTLLPAPSGGVPADDAIREDAGDGKMRVYLVGNRTSGQPIGSLRLTVGGAYLEPATYRLEGGAVLATRATGSVLVEPPALRIARGGTTEAPLTDVAWTLPLLGGSPGTSSGAASTMVTLQPGPIAVAGGGARVHELTIEVETSALEGWRLALASLVGTHGTVTAVASGPADNGTVIATVLPPPGTDAETRGVTIDLRAVRYDVALADKAG